MVPQLLLLETEATLVIFATLHMKKNNASMVHAGEQVGSGPANWDELVCYAACTSLCHRLASGSD